LEPTRPQTGQRAGGRRGARPCRRVAQLVACGLALALVAGACGSSSGSGGASTSGTIGDEGTPVEGGNLILALPSAATGWNPHDSQWAQPASFAGSAVLEPLATIDANLDAVPWLATSWTPNATFDQWTIALRPNVTFQNGEPFDAAAVALNINDATTAALSSQAVKGLITGASVVDDLTVRVDMSQPWAAFPSSFLNGQSAMMMAPAMLTSPNRGNDHPIGTGPFTFASWDSATVFKTVKNESYWQEGLPHLDQLEFHVLSDSTSQANALQTGDVNMVFTASAEEANNLASSYTVLKDWGSQPGMVITQTLPDVKGTPNPLANTSARQALAYATDRQSLAAAVGEGVQTPSSPFPPSSKWGLPEDQNGYPSFDLDRAKELVDQYESETGESSLRFVLSATADIDTQKVAQLVQSQWEEAGIDASIEQLDSSAFISKVVQGDYQAAFFNIYSSPDPDQNYYFWSESTAKGVGQISLNFTELTNPAMQASLQTGRQSPDFATRKKAYDDIVVNQINANAVNIWTYSTPYSLIASPTVHGLKEASEVPFGNFQPKTWLGNLWLST
jgi:peptide/nickel transport system substrate-binding protein